jgi:hypothetical protein
MIENGIETEGHDVVMMRGLRDAIEICSTNGEVEVGAAMIELAEKIGMSLHNRHEQEVEVEVEERVHHQRSENPLPT